jgi:uroporphyrinogen-III decarboxylase
MEGRAVDRMPVTVLYNQLYYRDHFAELTGRPAWEMHRWIYADPEAHLSLYRRMIEQAPFEVLQPQPAPSRGSRANLEFVARDGAVFAHNKSRGTCTPLKTETVSGHATDYAANQTQYVRDRADVDAHVKVTKAEDLISTGVNDFAEAAVKAFGRDHFILAGGVVGTLYSCTSYVGQTNLLEMLVEQPDLISHLSRRLLDQNIEIIRQLAAAGGDAIYIDDAFATNDMISVAHYERFCLPYVREMVREIHRLGRKAVLIYFGGIADRLEQIASLDADALSFETSMKGYVNDVAEIARRIGGRLALFGNLDPVGILQNGTDGELEKEIARQAAAGRHARGFVICTGSPITPSTPVARVRRFIELAHQYGKAIPRKGPTTP